MRLRAAARNRRGRSQSAEADPSLDLFTDLDVREPIRRHQDAATPIVDEVEHSVLSLQGFLYCRLDGLGALLTFQQQLARRVLDPDLDLHQAPFPSVRHAPFAFASERLRVRAHLCAFGLAGFAIGDIPPRVA
jgi:hypothetical protein